jgi:hypothetical protein
MPNLSTIAQGSERPILSILWQHADNTTGEDLTGAVLTGYIKDLATGNIVEIQGAIAVTDAAAGTFTWTPDPFDVAEDGAYQVQFSATWPGEPTPGLTAVFDWEIAESIIPTDAPSALPDYQGVVKLLARTTDPDAAPTGYYGLFVKDGALWLIDESGTLTAFDDGSTAAAAAIAAHVAEGDPHPGYLTEVAAASTYSASGHTHDYAASSHSHDYAATAHNHDSDYAAGEHTHDYSAVYAAAAHAHDSDYISIIATPTEGNIPTITSGGELANSAYAPSSFATSGHDHTGVYSVSAHTHTQTRYLTLGRAGTLTATAGTARLYVPFACAITNVRASVGTAPTGASIIVDVLKGGVTLWGTNPGNRPTITATNFADLTNTPDTTAISADDYLTLTVAQIGSTVAGADLMVVVEVTL